MHSWDDGSHKDDPKQLQAIWSALCNSLPAPLLPHKHTRGAHGAGAAEEDSKLLAVMETARVEKHAKSRLAVAADHFNRDYKKGFQFLQVNPVFQGILGVGSKFYTLIAAARLILIHQFCMFYLLSDSVPKQVASPDTLNKRASIQCFYEPTLLTTVSSPAFLLHFCEGLLNVCLLKCWG